MDRFKLKGLLILAVLIVGILFAAPSFFGSKGVPQGWIGPKEKIKLGLDLQGGMHLVLRVVADKAVESRMNSTASDLKAQMVKQRIHYSSADSDSPETLRIVLRVPDDYGKLADLIRGGYPYLQEADRSSKDGTMTVKYRISDREAAAIRSQAVEQALETVRNRIDQFGVSEPSIIPQGGERIVLQLPGVTDPERAKSLLKNTAILEFKLVDEEHSVQDALRGNVPSGSYIAYMKD
ncbi:MAG: protein translocase subunit SecD, partial [Desulfomonilia bacterium]